MAACNVQRCVSIVWPIMHVLYDPENRHNGQIWIDLLVYSFIFKEPKIFQQASLMFIIILMKSKSSQKRRERQEDGKSKHNNNISVSLSCFILLALSFCLSFSLTSFIFCFSAAPEYLDVKKQIFAVNEPSTAVENTVTPDLKRFASSSFYKLTIPANTVYASMWCNTHTYT